MIIKLDASCLRDAGCFRKLWLTAIEGYRAAKRHNDIEYGSAFHIFRESYVLTGGNFNVSLAKAVEYWKSIEHEITVKPKKEWLNLNHLTATCLTYVDIVQSREWQKYHPHLSSSGIPLVEQTFAIPLYVDDKTGLQILLEGTIDELGYIEAGCHYIDDIKTTSFWDSNTYFRQYLVSSQLLVYKYAIQWYAAKYPQSVFGTMVTKGSLGCSITGVFLKKDSPTVFKKQLYFYSDAMMAEFTRALMALVYRITVHATLTPKRIPEREGILTGACKGIYGEGDECKYFQVCSAPEKAMEVLLGAQFTKQPYAPLRFRKNHQVTTPTPTL